MKEAKGDIILFIDGVWSQPAVRVVIITVAS